MRRPDWLHAAGRRLAANARFAAEAVLASRQRAALATLGIAIGVASVVALISIGKEIGRAHV